MADALRLLVVRVALAAPAVAIAVPAEQDFESDDTAKTLGGAIATRCEAHRFTVDGRYGTALVRSNGLDGH